MEKVKQKRAYTALTPTKIFEDLKKVKAFIDNAKEPVRIYHLVSNSNKGTVGFVSSAMLRVLVENNILRNTRMAGYTWNSKIPVTPVLAHTIYNYWQTYRIKNNLGDFRKPVLPCSGHSVEPAKIKRVGKPKEMPKQESWFKRVIKVVFNIK